MGCFNMLLIITHIGVLESWIMLGDFSILSDTNLIICLMHQILTDIIRCDIAINCFD